MLLRHMEAKVICVSDLPVTQIILIEIKYWQSLFYSGQHNILFTLVSLVTYNIQVSINPRSIEWCRSIPT